MAYSWWTNLVCALASKVPLILPQNEGITSPELLLCFWELNIKSNKIHLYSPEGYLNAQRASQSVKNTTEAIPRPYTQIIIKKQTKRRLRCLEKHKTQITLEFSGK